MNEKILKDNEFKLNDNLFDINMAKILSKAYELKNYILYPYFSVELSKKIMQI